MPGAGTDKTKRWIERPGPVVILVEPQLGENIGSAARAMANFGLSRLRLVNPRDGWPNLQARRSASGADRILDAAELYPNVEAASADCTLLFATTARQHDQAKPVIGPAEAARIMAPPVQTGETVGVMFGRERYGLENEEVGLADQIITLPVNPAFASLNLSQAVLVIAYEWYKLVSAELLPFSMPVKSSPATKEQLLAFFANLERELERVEFFRPPEKRETMTINLRNIFTRMQLTRQDIQTLHGVIMAIAEGRKGPARGGVLDGAEAQMLRRLLSEHGAGRVPSERGPVRGLARLLRRNPTDAERILWDAITKDRRFAGLGFKRQVPVGPHVLDLVSFPLRVVVEIEPSGEGTEPLDARDERRSWLNARGYSIFAVSAEEVTENVKTVVDRIASAVALGKSPETDR